MPLRQSGQCLLTATRCARRKTAHRSLYAGLFATSQRIKHRAQAFSTSSSSQNVDSEDHPRWQRTPVRMRAPFRSRPPIFNNEFRVNEDPDLLDHAYVNMLGKGGDQMLSEEVKWLAVTHKSFDHGRRGFNDRLAFLGKRIVHLQTSLALVYAYSASPSPPPPDKYERQPFEHPSLDGLRGLTAESKNIIDHHRRLAQLAEKYEFDRVVRWKPRESFDLWRSGCQLVYAQTLFAIIGALALEKGGEVANSATRERILKPLGLE